MSTTMPMIKKVERYAHYDLDVIRVSEWKGMHALMGMNSQWQIECIHVLPINGWRGRNLAEELCGARDSGLLKLGTAKLVRASFLQELPQWDIVNTRWLAKFSGVVAIEVVAHNSGYGHYITVKQIEPSSDTDELLLKGIELVGKQIDMLKEPAHEHAIQ